MLMSCIAEMVGGVIFGMLIGVIGTSITSGRLADRKYKDKMEKIAEYMRVKQVPISLRRRIRVHYENLYKHHTVFNESEFLQKMSPQLKNETVDYIYRDIIGKVPILNGLSENVVHKICLAFEPWTAARGMAFPLGLPSFCCQALESAQASERVQRSGPSCLLIHGMSSC